MMLYEKWHHLPWKVFKNPIEQWKVLPTFLIGEYLFILLALVGFIHAYRQGPVHKLVWIGALVTGSANDIFFMYLPLVDNFWQAQATIMITPRLPLYIPCVYIVFLYYSTVSVWRLGLPRGAEACLTGLLAEAIYCIYDIVGIKFLWWTWHDTDPPIKERILNVPIGSSLWVITFSATFAFLIRASKLEREQTFGKLCLLILVLITTPLMMAQMAFLQLLSAEVQGEPTNRSFMTCIALYSIVILAQFPCRSVLRHPASHFVRRSYDKILNIALTLYYFTVCGLMAFGHPEKHVSQGIHQMVGRCYVEQHDFSGQLRYQFLCINDYDEDWDFRCSKLPRENHDWYTICGKNHSDFPLWMVVILILSIIGLILYSAILRFGKDRRTPHKKNK